MPTLATPTYPTILRDSGSHVGSQSNYTAGKAAGSNTGVPITDVQVRIDPSTGQLQHNASYRYSKFARRWLDYDKLRTMRRDPTIALARETAVAPIVGSTWATEITADSGADEEQKIAVDRYIAPFRNKLLRNALLGEIDFGWRAYEKVFNSVDDAQLGRRFIIPQRIKPLLNDNTWARYTQEGDFDGLLHSDPNGAGWFNIDRGHSLFANFDDDGIGNYNDPRLLRAESAYDEWIVANSAAKRFDEKIAGAIWVIHYPEGRNTYKGVINTDNREIAQDIIYQIKASGHIAIPSKLMASANETIENFGQAGWRVELLESSDKQHGFIGRLDYLDKLKVRSMGILERAILEGNYGTKAEAESHINVMLLNMQLKHEDLTEYVNQEIVDQFTFINFGTVGSVRFIAHPLADSRRENLLALFTQLLTNPDTMLQITETIDVKEICDELKIPLLSENEREQRDNSFGNLFRAVGESGAEQNLFPEK